MRDKSDFFYLGRVVLLGILCLGVLRIANPHLSADEGMFPISELGRLQLKAKGLEMDPGDLFSTDKICLVDGICRVNGCTGSFVSPTGLIITNHHCAYRAIQTLSTAERGLSEKWFPCRDATGRTGSTGI